MPTYIIVIYSILGGWILFSLYYINRLRTKGVDRIIPYVYDTIPSVFTTIGILGTFLGIYFGLKEFDVDNITESIPDLLEGLKTAFITSIWGISLSLIFGKFSQYVQRVAEKKDPPKETGELGALNAILEELKSQKQHEILDQLKLNNKDSYNNFLQLHNALVGESDDSLSTHFVKLRSQQTDLVSAVENQKDILLKVSDSLGGDGETSLLTQIQKLRLEQKETADAQRKNVEFIVKSMAENNELIAKKFDEFAELLAKNNTEALVEVMKAATDEFNKQMSAIVEKLVQENFEQLNNSVERMNTWQQENKEMIQTLTNQFKEVAENLGITSEELTKIKDNTAQLTNENSHLVKLIEALQEVMIEDTKYQEIVGQLTSAIDTLKENTDAFDETTNKLNEWVKNQMNFNDSVAKLLTRLEEIDRIKDINEVFWNNTKKQLNEGVSIIERSSERLANDLEEVNQEFYQQLNDTLQNLDRLIQRIIENYN